VHTGRAVCIGVDTSDASCAYAEADAVALAELAERQGFRSPARLLGAAASRSSVLGAIEDTAAVSRPGDLVLLTFSGHGGRKACDANGASSSIWVLADGSLWDAEMHEALAGFRPGVRVLVISDCCNGGVPTCNSAFGSRVSASVLVLAGCQPDQHADAGGMAGHFTTVLLDTWRGNPHVTGYPEFYRHICARMPGYQKPSFYRAGARDPEFERQRPFTI
jgi:hypothetical protein